MAEIIASGKPVQYVESNFKTHTFTKTIYGMGIQFSVLKMEQSILIWIGLEQEKSFSDMNLALLSKYGKSPLSTHLMGNSTELISNALASKLSRKLNKPVYLCYNVPDNKMTTEVVRTLMEEIQNKPECF